MSRLKRREPELQFKNERQKWAWTDKQNDRLRKIQGILEEWQEFKPLTLRQIYYQMIGKGHMLNKDSSYQAISKIVKYARIDGLISWDDVEDRTRIFHDNRGWSDTKRFIEGHLNWFLTGYQRDLMQSQDVYLEIWLEKDALSSIFNKIAQPFTVPLCVDRGFNSASFLHNYQERIALNEGKRPIILHFSDYDPAGKSMQPAVRRTFEDEMGVKGITFKRCALLKEDITKYNLPIDVDAVNRKNDTRKEAFKASCGEYAVELDALPPNVLEDRIRVSIMKEICWHKFEQEKATHDRGLDEIKRLKEKVDRFVSEKL